jgi:hypothetical protein
MGKRFIIHDPMQFILDNVNGEFKTSNNVAERFHKETDAMIMETAFYMKVKLIEKLYLF